jgi:hypothetical protein
VRVALGKFVTGGSVPPAISMSITLTGLKKEKPAECSRCWG